MSVPKKKKKKTSNPVGKASAEFFDEVVYPSYKSVLKRIGVPATQRYKLDNRSTKKRKPRTR